MKQPKEYGLALCMAIVAVLCFVATVAMGEEVKLAWDPSEGATGYRIYNNEGKVIDIGNNTQAIVEDLRPGATYTFTVTAYSASGLESGHSNFVVHVVPRTPVTRQHPYLKVIIFENHRYITTDYGRPYLTALVHHPDCSHQEGPRPTLRKVQE